jgi:type II secretory pathway component GspD/PulD (secretin)
VARPGAAVAALAGRPEAAPDRGAAPAATHAAEAVPASSPPGPGGTPDPAPSPSVPAPRAPADSATGVAARRFASDFEDADLPALVRLVGGITGKRFILSGPLPAVRATVHSPEPVTADEAFVTILQANGLTVVRTGPFWKIVPLPGR